DPASRALLDSNALGPRDRLLARGLAALAEWRMADACDVYRRLIARDPRDFAAHFGLGDCLSRDRVVIRDRSSPTSWRFRGSLQTAIQEYLRALELVPSYLEGSRGQTFGSLTNRILFDDPSMVRLGFALTPDTIWMGAYPEIQNDTLAFYPRPRAQFIATGEPATHRDAVARNRDQLRVLSERWVRLFPQSSAAWEHYAKALESVGILDTLDVTRRGPGALGAVDRAIRLAGADTLARLTQEATRVRVLLKLRRFAAAQASAESAIASRPSRSAGDAAVLAPLAALTGRARLTSTLLAIAATDSNNELFSDRHGGGRVLPVPVMTAAGAFAGYAAFGAPADSLRATRDRLERTIRNSVGVTSRDAVRSTVFLPWSFQAEPTLGTSLLLTVHDARERLLVPWQSLGRNDPAAARQTVAREAERIRASDFLPAPDVSLQFALLALAVGDTSAARLVLDHVIAALPELSTRLTTEVNPAAALPRVLALRAQLARRDETGAIATWAAARPLWLRADPEVLAAFDVLGVSRGVR
ncbi:MAG TPA: hypothetical protein VJN70_17675, partial [Gemmatimonadaceae bacterium]|nr:hypothetical protein [Gemmatimonadaceae bacterium]